MVCLFACNNTSNQLLPMLCVSAVSEVNYTVVHKNTWQSVYDFNSVRFSLISVIFATGIIRN